MKLVVLPEPIGATTKGILFAERSRKTLFDKAVYYAGVGYCNGAYLTTLTSVS